MTDYLILVAIGISMGLFGGLLGIGGSVVMIPALVLAFGENQHLYQASAMICNFFVAAAATVAHKGQEILVGSVVKYMAPVSVLGSIGGVVLSNAPFFSHGKSYVLAHIFGLFLIYVIYHNVVRLYRDYQPKSEHIRGEINPDAIGTVVLSIIIGFITGIAGGLLGLGGGTVCIPLQQVLLKMPLKKAIANSAATIILIAAVGATLKNATLSQHDIMVTESLKIAGVVIPSAIIAGFAGARLMHTLPKRYVRMAFIGLLVLASYKMLTV
jgi:uncharacterized membrane protein YfcA